MLDKLKKIFRNEFKKSNFKAFTFFLVFSSIIWLLVQFSKQYTAVIAVPLQYEHFPKDKIIKQKSNLLEMRVQQSGFQLAWFKFFQPKIVVDLSKLPADGTSLIYKIHQHRDKLEEKLPIDLNHVEFLNEEVHIPYQLKRVKKIPLVSKINIQYAPGYSSEKGVVLQPDSIKISGPESVLDTITHLFTERITRKEVDSDLKDEVALRSPLNTLTLYQENVNYQVQVEKFTERQLRIPIKIINAPEGVNISLYPPTVQITFNVSLDKYRHVQPMDFKVVCDYNALSDHQAFFIPEIVDKPEIIQNIRLSPLKVQYVIKK